MRSVIVNTASVYAEKSPEVWIEIAHACLETDDELSACWIGAVSGPYAGLAAAAEARSGGRIAFPGARSHDAVLRYLKDHRCLLLIASRIEVFPMSIMEAAACGVPVVCRRFPGWEDVLGEDHPFTFDTVAEGVDATLRARAGYARASRQSRALFDARFAKDETWYADAAAFARSAGIGA